MLFVNYPKCSTCRKAKKWLDEHDIEYDSRHIIEDNPTADELRKWWEISDLPLKRFFNTSGMKYRELKLKDKLPDMSEDEQLDLLATDGMLVKRPILAGDDVVLVGFKVFDEIDDATVVCERNPARLLGFHRKELAGFAALVDEVDLEAFVQERDLAEARDECVVVVDDRVGEDLGVGPERDGRAVLLGLADFV